MEELTDIDPPPPPDAAELKLIDQIEARALEMRPLLATRLLQYASHDPDTMAAALPFALKPSWGYKDFRAAGDLYLVAKRRCHPASLDDICACRNALSDCHAAISGIRDRRLSKPDAEPVDAGWLAELEGDFADLPPPIALAPREMPADLTPLSQIGAAVQPFGTLIDGTANLGSLVLFYGPSGIGKTFTVLDAALNVAAGRPWRGRKTNPGAVLYVAAEDAAGVRDRAAAWCVRHGVTDAPFAVLDRSLDFTTEAGAVDLLAAVYGWQAATLRPVVMVVIDTLAAAFGGRDENLGPDMKAFVSNAARIQRETGAAVAVVHHSGKATSAGPRGHGSLAAAADVIFRLEAGRAVLEKQRSGVAGEVFAFRLAPVQIGADATGAPIMSAAIEHETPPKPQSRDTQPDLAGLLAGAVREASGRGIPFKMNKPGSLHDRRAELPLPLAGMGRAPIQTLARAAIKAGLIHSQNGVLAPVAVH